MKKKEVQSKVTQNSTTKQGTSKKSDTTNATSSRTRGKGAQSKSEQTNAVGLNSKRTNRTGTTANRKDNASSRPKKLKQELLTVEKFIRADVADCLLTFGNGDTGQLGHGEDVTVAKRPRIVKSFQDGTKFVQAVAGGMHSVVLTSTHEVFTCGCNDEGALGRPCFDDDGQQEDKDEDFIFRKVTFPENTDEIVMISAGDSHTAALTRDGSVYIWGTFRDKGGVLGLAMRERKLGQTMIKTKEPFLLSDSKDRIVVKIASGSNHLSMLTQDGKVYTSGAGDAGQLGRLSPHSRDSSISQRTVAKMMTPTEIFIKRSVHFNDIWCAGYCNFARALDGAIFVWGLNNYRQLGVLPTDPNAMEIHFPVVSEKFVASKSWKNFVGDHHILAVEDSGKCYGIGRGDDCRFGQGADKSSNSENVIEISMDGVLGVAAATGTSFYWTTKGEAFAWACNNEAELGLAVEEGSVVEKPKLIEIRGIQEGCRALEISANAQHTIMLAQRILNNSK